MNMDAMTVGEYWHSMLAIKANEQLTLIQANDAAWLKKQDRSKLIKSLTKQSNVKLDDAPKKPVMSTLEAAQSLARSMGG